MDGELEQLGERIAEQAAHLDAATHRLLVDLREFDKRGGWHRQGALSCAHWLSWRVGWSLVVARDHLRVAHRLADLPAIDDALRRGEVSYSKVRAMSRVATPANEELLLEYARLMPAAQLEITCRKYALVQRHGKDPHPLGDLQRRYVRRRDTEDGMVKIEAMLHPDEAEVVWKMLDHAATQLAREPKPRPEGTAAARDPHGDSAAPHQPSGSHARDASTTHPSAREACSTAASPVLVASDTLHDCAESVRTAASGPDGRGQLPAFATNGVIDSAESGRTAASQHDPRGSHARGASATHADAREADPAEASPFVSASGSVRDFAESVRTAASGADGGGHLPARTTNGVIGDSAESVRTTASGPEGRGDLPAFATNGVIGDSAESVRTAASGSDGDGHLPTRATSGLVGDSAESVRTTASGPEGRGDLPTFATNGVIGDSAESVRTAASGSDGDGHLPTRATSGLVGDSAESVRTTASGPDGDGHLPAFATNGVVDDSAESVRTAASGADGDGHLPARTTSGLVGDSAEAQRTAASGSDGDGHLPARATSGLVGDSAESVRTAASGSDGDGHLPARATSGLVGDSAESVRTAASGSDGDGHLPARATSGLVGDSAESVRTAASGADGDGHLPARTTNGVIGDSAESAARLPMEEDAVRTTSTVADAPSGAARRLFVAPAEARGALQGDVGVASGDSRGARSFLDVLLDELDGVGSGDGAADHRDGGREEVAPDKGESPLQQRADAVKRGFSRADALVALAQGYLRGDRPHRTPIEVTLTIPAASLRCGGLDPVEVGEMGGSLVSCEAARRLSCDCGVVDVVEDEQGTPLSVGRKRRTITGQLKRALHARDKMCTFPGCTNRLYLEGHHIRHWVDGGETSLENAALLCSNHHHHVHEYGYTIELGADGRPQFRDPHGWLVEAVPARPVTGDVGWPRIRAQNAPLGIDAETIACEWDGRPVPYGAIIGHLVVADGLQ